MNQKPFLRYILAGQIRREYLIPPGGKPVLDKPGGNLLYTAAGLGVWLIEAGLISRVGSDFPQEFLESINKYGFDCRGIKKIEQELDIRSFIAYSQENTPQIDNPVAHFSLMGLQFPKTLLGYNPIILKQDDLGSITDHTLRLLDIPSDYFDANAAHICPMDYMSQSLLLSKLHQSNIHTITIEIASEYMNMGFWDPLPKLVKDISVFLTSEENIRNLFIGRSTDLWEMAQIITSLGCEFVVIKRGLLGQLLFEKYSGKRLSIPAYPSRLSDPTGAGNAFCGGFLHGYCSTYDAVEGVLYGNISSSLAVEGSGSFYTMNALPGLAQARLETIRGNIKKI